MASTVLVRGCYIWTANTAKIGSMKVTNTQIILSSCNKIIHQAIRNRTYCSQILNTCNRCTWPHSANLNIPRACFSSLMITNSFHSSSICTSGNDDTDRNKNHQEGQTEDAGLSGSNISQNYLKGDGQQFLEERRQDVKAMLDDAQAEKSQPNYFDFSNIPQQKEVVTEKRLVRPKVDPSETSVLLFPGQGAQFVGMGKQLLHYPVVKDMYEVASEILGYDLLALCLNGPKEDLDRTVHCQPAILVTSLAAIEKLKNENPKSIEDCVTAAGFSVGEYTALVFGGALSFEDAIYLIKVRAEAMQRASDLVPSGMISVIGGPAATYKQICADAANHCKTKLKMEKPVCRVANYLFQQARVLAGNNEALEFIYNMKRQFHLRKIQRLPVSGAFHTPLMAPAEDALSHALESVTIEEPLINIHSNVDSKHYCHTKHIHKQLCKQLVEPVLWEQTMREIYQRQKGQRFPETYECGPGNQLGTMLQRFNLKAFQSYYKVDV